MGGQIKELYKKLCKSEWSPTTTGILIGLFTILIMAWWRPWGAVGAIRNWGDWMIHGFANMVGAESGFLELFLEWTLRS